MLNHARTIDESVHAYVSNMDSWEFKTILIHAIHLAKRSTAFNSRRGIVTSLRGANFVFIPNRKMYDSRGASNTRRYTTAAYLRIDASQNPNNKQGDPPTVPMCRGTCNDNRAGKSETKDDHSICTSIGKGASHESFDCHKRCIICFA
jgi:hypothetical protein